MEKNLIESSRGSFVPSGQKPHVEELKLGCLQRIASSTEAMAENYTKLIEERDRFEGWYRDLQFRHERLHRKLSAQRGIVTRLKREIDRLKGERANP